MSNNSRSRVISARLHPSDEHEEAALAVFDDLVAQGYNARQIFTDALLRANGYTPDMFRRDTRIDNVIDRLESHVAQMPDVSEKLDTLIGLFEARMDDLLRNIKNADPQAFREFANAEPTEAHTFSDEFIVNAQKAARRTFKQMNGG